MAEMERWSLEVVKHNHPLLPASQDLWVMQRISRGVETTQPGEESSPTVLIETHAIPFARRASLYRDGARVIYPVRSPDTSPVHQSQGQDPQLLEFGLGRPGGPSYGTRFVGCSAG